MRRSLLCTAKSMMHCPINIINLLPPANEVWGKVIFSEACVKNSVHGGGEYLGRYTPWTGQVHPPGPGRYTPWDQAGTPPGPGRYPPRTRQVHPPPGTRQVYPPRTRELHSPPWDQAGTPQTRYSPGPGRYTSQTRQVPPPSSACWEIQATSGWYTSYWNAFLNYIESHLPFMATFLLQSDFFGKI